MYQTQTTTYTCRSDRHTSRQRMPKMLEEYRGFKIVRMFFGGHICILDGWDYIQEPFCTVEDARVRCDELKGEI